MWPTGKPVSYTHLYTIKQLEKSRKSLEVRMAKLNDQSRKDDVITFEELGVDKLFADEAHAVSYTHLDVYKRQVGTPDGQYRKRISRL